MAGRPPADRLYKIQRGIPVKGGDKVISQNAHATEPTHSAAQAAASVTPGTRLVRRQRIAGRLHLFLMACGPRAPGARAAGSRIRAARTDIDG
ncbi:hypothetical protein GCM10027081_32350 [Cupriavidus yeoncheonensis]